MKNGSLIIVFLILLFSCISESGGDKPRTSLSNYEAKLIAEGVVKQNLKSPSTAEFSGVGETEMRSNSPNNWTIIGHVDSQNGFGAMIRSQYECTVYLSGQDILYKDLKIK